MEAIANYTAERAAFAHLWHEDCAQRIVFYRGQSGSGKSTLLRSCYKAAPNTLHKEFIDLKPGTVNVADIFSRLERRLGADKLPRFRQRLLALSPSATAQIDGNQIQGSGNLLNITLNTGDQAEREDRRIALTDAWLDDVQALDRPLLIVIDAYDHNKASTEVKSWLHSVLPRVPYAEPLRLAIGGQDVPDTNTGEEWAECCCPHELNGVAEAKYWLPVVKAMGRSFPAGVPDPLSYLACLCDVHQGHPKLISDYIQAKFPKAL